MKWNYYEHMGVIEYLKPMSPVYFYLSSSSKWKYFNGTCWTGHSGSWTWEVEAGGMLRVQGWAELNSKFQDSLSYRVKNNIGILVLPYTGIEIQFKNTLSSSYILSLLCLPGGSVGSLVFLCFALWDISNDLGDQKQSFNKIYTCVYFFFKQKCSWHALKSLFFIFYIVNCL